MFVSMTYDGVVVETMSSCDQVLAPNLLLWQLCSVHTHQASGRLVYRISGSNSDTVLSNRIVSSLEQHRNWSTYKYRMESIFQPPFNGSCYFRLGWDDSVIFAITPLDENGADAGPTETLYDRGFTG